MTDTHLRDALELTLIPGIGTLSQKRLWKSSPDISPLFSQAPAELEAMGISLDACLALSGRHFRAMADEIIAWGKHEGCHFLLRGEPPYPKLLDEIYDPPLLLYARGNPALFDNPAIAIVGTRRPTPYGLQMAQGIAHDLARRGITIVSGLARGIDAGAHRGCLETPHPTIAVLGCGIDIVYPREHRHLTQQIIENGVIISEFPPGTSPAPQNFPIRNRIISGMSMGTMIVEASEYSGSLITARLSMEQNREVFALPGNITSPQSFGPNFLIKQGAKLVQSWRDIVEEMPIELRRQIFLKEDSRPIPVPELRMLSEEEARVLTFIDTDRATQFDRIYKNSGLDIPALSNLLLTLEMQGWIHQIPGNLYIRVAKPPA